jgi:hypothetical protein
LYLGSAEGLATLPVLQFASADSYDLGLRAVALGNFDADPENLMDFALSAPGSERVFVVRGRRSWPAGPVVLDAGGCAADLCLQGDPHSALGRALTSVRFDQDEVPDLVAADQAGAVVLLGGTLSTNPILLGASGTGLCLDARSTPLTDACGNGQSRPPRGFYLEAPAPVDQLASPERGALFLAHAGSPGRSPAVWFAPPQPYVQRAGLARIPSAQLVLAHSPATSSFLGNLASVGDLDGDGAGDLAWGAGNANGFVQLYLAAPDGQLTAASTLLDDTAGAAENAFGRSIALAAHPELGALGDVNGDGWPELLVSAPGEGSGRGSVMLFDGSAPLSSSPRLRSGATQEYGDASLPAAPANESGAYPRSGQYVGDVDGDGHVDLAIVEPAYDGGVGRVIVLGECKP